MSGKVTYKQIDIVLTKFQFSNLMDYKVRPVLVFSKVLSRLNSLFSK